MEFRPSNRYQPFGCDEDGRIKNMVTGRVRKTSTVKNGYEVVGTRDDLYYVHRIVADVYCENSDPLVYTDVNHINGDKSDNRACNLEWCSKSYNMKHAAENNLLDTTNRKRGEDCNLSSYTEEDIRGVCSLLSQGMRSIDVSKQTSIPPSYIKEIKLGYAWAHISKEYHIPKFKRQSLSKETVSWICQKIVDGHSNKDIIDMAKNPKVKSHTIKNIKAGSSYRDISRDYF